MADDWIIDFPTLADLQDAWVRRHVRQPDGILRGKPFCWSDWQFWYAAHRWRVREDAEFVPARGGHGGQSARPQPSSSNIV